MTEQPEIKRGCAPEENAAPLGNKRTFNEGDSVNEAAGEFRVELGGVVIIAQLGESTIGRESSIRRTLEQCAAALLLPIGPLRPVGRPRVKSVEDMAALLDRVNGSTVTYTGLMARAVAAGFSRSTAARLLHKGLAAGLITKTADGYRAAGPEPCSNFGPSFTRAPTSLTAEAA